MATDLDRWVFRLSLRRIWASSLQQFPRKLMLKSQIQLSHYDQCQTQRPKEFKECRPFQIYQSALGLPRQPAVVFPPFKSARVSQALIGRFETACIPWIPLVAEFGTDHIEKAVFVTSSQHRFSRKLLERWSSNSAKSWPKNPSIKIRRHFGEIFSIFALIPVWSGGGRGWRPLSCKPCLPFLS